MVHAASIRRATPFLFSLFLGDLSVTSKPEDVSRAIEGFGVHGVEVKICFGSDGVQRRYGFLNFPSAERRQGAYERLRGGFKVNGRTVRIYYGEHGIGDATPFKADGAVHSVHVQGISKEPINEADLELCFEAHGKVIDVCILGVKKVRRDRLNNLIFQSPCCQFLLTKM
jgi:RNA recognition motif-containing protein